MEPTEIDRTLVSGGARIYEWACGSVDVVRRCIKSGVGDQIFAGWDAGRGPAKVVQLGRRTRLRVVRSLDRVLPLPPVDGSRPDR